MQHLLIVSHLLLLLLLFVSTVHTYRVAIVNRYLHKHSKHKHTIHNSNINTIDYAIDDDDDTTSIAATPAPLKQMKIVFDCTLVDPDELSELLFEIGVLSVSCEVQSERKGVFNDEKRWIDMQKTQCWSTALLRANFPSSFNADGLQEILKFSYPDIPFIAEIVDVEAKDWVLHVQKDWKPCVIGDDLTIRFPWHADYVCTTANELILEGGAAFGTGDHATTRLCCKWIKRTISDMKRNSNDEVSICDIGCGSAILGLAALKYGATKAVGTDIDRDALLSASNNCRMNGLEMDLYLVEEEDDDTNSNGSNEVRSIVMNKLRGTGGDVAADTFKNANELIHQKFDMTVANILAPILMYLAPQLAAYTKPGGKIALSGLVTLQKDAIMDRFSQYFADVKVEDTEEDWILITGTRLNDDKV